MSSIDFDKLKSGVAEYFDGDAEALEALGKSIATSYKAQDWVTFNVSLGSLIEAGVMAVEKLKTDIGDIAKGQEKKDALVNFLDGCINIGFIPDKILDLDGHMIGILIDNAVRVLNKYKPEWVNE